MQGEVAATVKSAFTILNFALIISPIVKPSPFYIHFFTTLMIPSPLYYFARLYCFNNVQKKLTSET